MRPLSFHFLELRLRFLYISLSCILSLILSYKYKFELVYVISKPFLEFQTKFIFLDLTEALYTIIRISGVISFLSILPLILYHFWCFLIPSCYNFERKVINNLICVFLLLFLFELLVIYFFIFPKICEFFMSFEVKSLENSYLDKNLSVLSVELAPRIQSYFKLIYHFFFLILSIFQLPFAFTVIYSRKWINFSTLCEKRKYIFFFCILLSAFISPPDFVSQSILCFFSYSIYEFIIFLVYFMNLMIFMVLKTKHIFIIYFFIGMFLFFFFVRDEKKE